MAVCYRHKDRETGVSCSNCGNPICPDCMTPTPVGMRCPECSKQKTQVKTMRSMAVEPTVAYVLIAINVLMYFGQQASSDNAVYRDFVLFGPLVADGEWWRLLTAGFLHGGTFHLLLNMYALFFLGRMLEPALGHVRFGAIYFAALLAGSFGAVLLNPATPVVGASTAIFGLFGAAIVMARNRGIDIMASGLGPILLINLAITFFPGLNISIGGHLGGLVGGAAAAFAMERLADRRPGIAAPIAACVAVGAIAVVAAIVAAGRSSPFAG
jgi:membrane associated rhomboid family serine protease